MWFNQEYQKIEKLKQEIRTEFCAVKLLNIEH
jgi:hypothetical protein